MLKAKILFGISLIFLFVFSILFFSLVSSDEPIEGDTIHSRTANTNTYRTPDNQFKTVYYSGAVNMPNQQGKYTPFNDVVNVSWKSGAIQYDWYDKSFRLKPLIIYNNNTYTIAQVKQAYPNVDLKSFIEKPNGKAKFSFNISGIPDSIKDNINFIVFQLDGATNLSWDDVSRVGTSIFLPDNIELSYQDLVDSGFTLNLVNKTYLKIGNVSGQNSLWLDPVASYNYSDETNIFALGCDEEGGDSPPPADGPIPTGCDNTPTDITSRAELNADDNSKLSFDFPEFNTLSYEWQVFYAQIQQNTNDITNMTWLWNGESGGSSNTVEVYIWNQSSSGWVLSGSVNSATDADIIYSTNSNSSDFLNSTNFTHYLAQSVWDDTSQDGQTDFVSLSVTYDALVVNTPTSSQEILNNLSTVLNTSQAGYNQTIWYTWNTGIINTTLCTDSLECQGTITFPRQGYYNLTVYANKTDGTETSQTVSDLFVGSGTDYDFSAAYDGDQMKAFEGASGDGWTGCDITGSFNWGNPTTLNIDSSEPILDCMGTLTDISTDSDLDTNDGNRNFHEIDNSAIDGGGGFIFVANPDEDASNLTFMSWTIDVTSGDSNDLFSRFLLWNNTGSEWFQCAPKEDTGLRNCVISSSTTDFVNDSGQIHLGVFGDWDGETGFDRDIGIDYVALTIKSQDSNTAPTVSLVLANNTNFSVSSINLSYNYTDDNDFVNNITLFIDDVTNESRGIQTDLDTNLNFTITIADGTYTYLVSVTDSDGSITNSSTNTFTVDTTAPSVNIIIPPDTASYDVNEIDLNYTVSDLGVGLDTCLYQNDTDANVTIACGTNATISQGTDGTYSVTVCANDTLGNLACDTNTWTISTTAPAITLVSPFDGMNPQWFQSGTDVSFNFTASDANGVDTCSLYGNWTGSFILNLTDTFGSDTSVDVSEGNFTQTIPEGFFDWNVFCNDTNNDDSFASSNFTFGIDETTPLANLTHPLNITYTTTSLDINFTSSDTNLDTCFFTDDGITNTTLNCNNRSYTASQGSTTITLFVNDSANNLNESSVTFFVDSINPLVDIIFPATSETYSTLFDYNINYTISDTNLDTCWWTDDDGGVNITITCGNNITGPWSEIFTSVIVYANDTLNNINSSSINFTIDATFPQIEIDSIDTTAGSQNFDADYILTETNPDSCFYSVFNSSGGIDGLLENITITCGTNLTTVTVSDFATFNLTIYAIDLAGSENSSTQEFTTTASAPAAPGGGGGAAPEAEVPFIGVQEAETSEIFEELSLGIVYAVLNNYCSELLTDEPLAIEDLSDECRLKVDDLPILVGRLADLDVDIDQEDLRLLVDNYQDMLLFQGSTSRANVDRFGLFVSQLGLVTTLQLQPPSLDKIISIYEPEGRNRTIPITITSNKNLKSCQVISDTPDLTCEIEDENIIRVRYFLNNTDFSSKVFSGTIRVITDVPDIEIEEQSISITLRIINLAHPTFRNIGIAILVALAGGVFFIRKRSKKKFLKQAKEFISLK